MFFKQGGFAVGLKSANRSLTGPIPNAELMQLLVPQWSKEMDRRILLVFLWYRMDESSRKKIWKKWEHQDLIREVLQSSLFLEHY